MDGCIFCKIIAGEIPAAKFYETEDVLGFMTIEAINRGHALIIPKQHTENFYELHDETYSSVMLGVKKAAVALKDVFRPKRVGIMVVGWDVPHAHIHVVPQNDNKDITSQKTLDGTMLKPSFEELKEDADMLKAALGVS